MPRSLLAYYIIEGRFKYEKEKRKCHYIYWQACSMLAAIG